MRSLHDKYATGVAIVIKNELRNKTQSVQPISDRLLAITLNASIPITLLSAYAPHAFRPGAEKDAFYHDLNDFLTKTLPKRAVVVGGDFNARVQRQQEG